MSDKVDFGYERVSPSEKTERVRGVFERVADRYDVMNDLMSLGTHRVLKDMLVQMSGVRPGDLHLDLAGGTADVARRFAPVVGSEGRVVLADINDEMMRVGRDRVINDGVTQVVFCQNSAEALPFADGSFACATIAFGLRNFTDKDAALAELRRVLKPGGRLLVLEFSHPENPLLAAAYGTFQTMWPGIGQLVTGDASAYRYLVDSIAVHPKPIALKVMIEDAGFEQVELTQPLGGIVAIHRGVVPATGPDSASPQSGPEA